MNSALITPTTIDPTLLAEHNRGILAARRAYRREQCTRERWCVVCEEDRSKWGSMCSRCDQRVRALGRKKAKRK